MCKWTQHEFQEPLLPRKQVFNISNIKYFSHSIGYVSRGQGRSPAAAIAYIFRQKVRDNYYGLIRDNRNRKTLLYKQIILPLDAPYELHNPQIFADMVDAAENRKDSRTLRTIRASLSNEPEFDLDDYVEMLREYVMDNFVSQGMCAVVAIHESKNRNPSKNNPHIHILLPTRKTGPNGFTKKNRDWDKKDNTTFWRANWANVQNRAYERKGLDNRVSHESYIMQGKTREPRKYLNRLEYGLERRGIHTIRGNENRVIDSRNKERQHQSERKQSREIEM
jgi:hypothetical protein